MNAVAVLLVTSAIFLLGGALMLAFRLFAEIPAGPTLLRWRINTTLLGAALLLAIASLYPLRETAAMPGLPLAQALVALLACLVLLLFQGASSLVNKLRQVSSLDRAVVTDALTGLRERAYLDKRMQEEMSRSRRHGQAVSLILLDVDDFASVNRAHGHEVGDQLLLEIGEILGAGLRTSDVLVRYAGEEMAVLATHTPPAGAFLVAERLRRDVEVGARKSLREAQGVRRNITLSAGVAGVDAGVRGKFDLFSAAERALDQAKKEGKNRVVLGPPGEPDFSLTIPPPTPSRH